MIFRYDFDKRLELLKFRQQAMHYVSIMPEIEYHIFTPDFQAIFGINYYNATKANSHLLNIKLFKLQRDRNKEITSKEQLIPLDDSTLNTFPDIVSSFEDKENEAKIESNDVKSTVDKIINIIRLLYKINGLKVFW